MRNRKTWATIAMACGLAGVGVLGCTPNDQYAWDGTDSGGPSCFDQLLLSESGTDPVPASEPTPAQVIALSQPATETANWLTVSSPSFSHARPIPERYTAYGSGNLPALSWSDAPKGTQSFAVIVEDPDALVPRPYVHLVLYNIPGSETSIASQDLEYAQSSDASGMTLGRNSSGALGYAAPQPQSGEPAHSYHFQVFALDKALSLPAGADKQAVIDAMQGHVLAKGLIIGTFQHR